MRDEGPLTLLQKASTGKKSYDYLGGSTWLKMDPKGSTILKQVKHFELSAAPVVKV